MIQQVKVCRDVILFKSIELNGDLRCAATPAQYWMPSLALEPRQSD